MWSCMWSVHRHGHSGTRSDTSAGCLYCYFGTPQQTHKLLHATQTNGGRVSNGQHRVRTTVVDYRRRTYPQGEVEKWIWLEAGNHGGSSSSQRELERIKGCHSLSKGSSICLHGYADPFCSLTFRQQDWWQLCSSSATQSRALTPATYGTVSDLTQQLNCAAAPHRPLPTCPTSFLHPHPLSFPHLKKKTKTLNH